MYDDVELFQRMAKLCPSRVIISEEISDFIEDVFKDDADHVVKISRVWFSYRLSIDDEEIPLYNTNNKYQPGQLKQILKELQSRDTAAMIKANIEKYHEIAVMVMGIGPCP